VTLCDRPEQADTPVDTRAIDLPNGVPQLRSLYLYLSGNCNLRCQHCWVAPERSETPAFGKTIDSKALQEAVIEAKTLGLSHAKLTGGEPMLHPRFKEIVDMLTAEDLSVSMETNGTLVTQEMAHYLKENTNLEFVSVSVDSSVAIEHDAFRGVEGAFDAALQGLDYLVEAGYSNCQVIMSVHRRNQNRIEEVAELAAEHKAASMKVNPVTPIGRGTAMHERGETLDFKEYVALAQWVNNDLGPRALIPMFMFTPLALTSLSELWRTKARSYNCGVANILGVLGTGEIALCGIGQTVPDLVYGHLRTSSIRDIWLFHPVILKLRRDLENIREYPGVCGSCIHAKSCRTGCVADNYIYGGELIYPQWLCAEADRKGVFPRTRRRDVRESQALER